MVDDDINSFLEKTTVLHDTIRAIADGTVDAQDISLKDYGILTEQEQEEEKVLFTKLKLEKERKKLEHDRFKKEEERRKWWEGAICLYGPRESCHTENAEVHSKQIDNKKNLVSSTRYSSDYTRWSDSKYVPDDEATKEEEQTRNQKIERIKAERFEEDNKDWCNQMKSDMAKRDEIKKQQQVSAIELRIKGNRMFKKKKYEEAIENYTRALEINPYDPKVLLNKAMGLGKVGKYLEQLEYCQRSFHLDKSSSKALYHQYKAHLALNQRKQALDHINRCIRLDPTNEDFICCRDDLSNEFQDSEVSHDFRHQLSILVETFLDKYKTLEQQKSNTISIKSQIIDLLETLSKPAEYEAKVRFDWVKSGIISLALRHVCSGTSLEDEDSILYSSFCDFLSSYLQGISEMKKVLSSSCIAAFEQHPCLVVALCKSISYLSQQSITEMNKKDHIRVVSSCAKLIGKISAEKDKLNELFFCGECQDKTNERSDPVICLMLALKLGIQGCSSDEQLNLLKMEMREMIVQAMYKLSSIKEMRASFILRTEILTPGGSKRIGISAIHILLALVKSNKSESIACREMSLMTISNLISHPEKNANGDSDKSIIINEGVTVGIVACGGIYFLIHLCTSPDLQMSSLTMKLLSSSMLLHLLSYTGRKECKLQENHVTKLWNEYEKIISSKDWLQTSESLHTAKTLASIAQNIIHILGRMSQKIDWVGKSTNSNASNVALSLITVLPVPRRGGKNQVTAESICQPPESPIYGSASAVARQNASFHCNILKVLINYLDASPAHLNYVLNEGGMECLICLLANSGSYHLTVAKNAACALARLIKSKDPNIMKRCRELRGIEILVELGKSGRILKDW